MSSAESRWENAIHAAIERLARERGDWVRLIDLRPEFLDRSPAALETHLKRLSREGKVHLVPESNRKALQQEDHDAAIRLGGDDNHLVCWDYHRHPRQLDAALASAEAACDRIDAAAADTTSQPVAPQPAPELELELEQGTAVEDEDGR